MCFNVVSDCQTTPHTCIYIRLKITEMSSINMQFLSNFFNLERLKHTVYGQISVFIAVAVHVDL